MRRVCTTVAGPVCAPMRCLRSCNAGKRVLSRREAAGYGQAGTSTVNVTINARDAESFRQFRTQVASDIARAVSMGRRGM